MTADDDRVVVRLDARTRGVAPGQSVVLYEGTRVVGSATITATSRAPRQSSSVVTVGDSTTSSDGSPSVGGE